MVSFGNLGLLEQYHIDWRVHEAVVAGAARAWKSCARFLDDGAITFDGEFFKLHRVVHLRPPGAGEDPAKMGAMGGPRSFEVAGEIADGMHHALGYSRENYEYVAEHVELGLDKSGRSLDDFDLGAWVVFAVAEDSEAAKRAARIMVGFYISSMPANQLARHGSEPGRPAADHRRPRRGRDRPRHRTHLAGARRHAVRGRYAGGVRRQAEDRHPAHRG